MKRRENNLMVGLRTTRVLIMLLILSAMLMTACGPSQYTLSTSVSPDGGVVIPANGTYDAGTEIELIAEPASGYRFDHWSGDATGTSSSITFSMDTHKKVVAHFKKVVYTLTTLVSPDGGGMVTPANGTYDEGTEIKLTAEPASGYRFDHWSGDATGTSSSITISMNSKKDVIAHFKMFFSSTFSQICKVSRILHAVPQAATYQGNRHPIVLLDSSGNKHDWSDDLPIEWLPTVVEETQLVVCVGEEKENKIELCYYIGSNINRYQYSLDLELREAKTGKIVASTTLKGSKPRRCMRKELKELTRIEGSHVSFEEVQEWLRRWVGTPESEPPVPSSVAPEVQPPATSPKLMYEDDFSNPTSGWKHERLEDHESDYEDGEYHIILKKSNWAGWDWNSYARQFTDFGLEIDARLISGPNKSAYGLIFRLQDGDNFYRFLVSGDGYYLVGTYFNGTWTELQRWKMSAFINQGDNTNHLKVVCRGFQIEMYVNGYYLTTVTDDSFAEGYVGMIVDTPEPGTRVAFDNIKVYSLD